MKNPIVLATDSPVHMAQLITLLAGRQGMPVRLEPAFIIRNPSGHMEAQFGMLNEHMFPVVFLRYLLTVPKTLWAALIEANGESIDRLIGGSSVAIKAILAPDVQAEIGRDVSEEEPGESQPELYVVKNADGQKIPGGTVKTAREFAASLIGHLTSHPDAVMHKMIMRQNSTGLSRMVGDEEDDLLDEIEEAAIDDL